MRVFVSTHFAVMVVLAGIFGGIGFGLAVTAQSWVDRVGGIGVMGVALFLLTADVWASLIVVGRSVGSAVRERRDLRARRRRLAYGQILDVEARAE